MKRLALSLILILSIDSVSALAQKKVEFLEPISGGNKGLLFPGLLMPDKGLGLFYLNLKGTFWRDPDVISSLSVTPAQQRKMDDIFQQYRLKLIDLNAALQKDELILAPLIDALPNGDDGKINAQIDKVAQDRAELEKANSKMLIGILQVLSPEQWTKLRDRKK